jgi:hypothetical protein
MRALKRRDAREERGAVLVLVAGGMLALIFVMVFVIDVSSYWTHKRHLALQADAATLAGGDLFAECFLNPANAKSLMEAEATKYSGGPGSLYNPQISSPVATVNPAYPNSDPCTASVAPGDSQASFWFQTDMSDTGAPLFFAGVVPGFTAPAITAKARVELFTLQAARALPVAIPDVNPSNVFVTFWNLQTGANLGSYDLGKGAVQNNVQLWATNSISLSVPPNTSVGMRVGVGNMAASAGASCFNSTGVTGQYMCFDNNPATPVGILHGNSDPSQQATTTPVLRSAAEHATNSNCGFGLYSPFFSDVDSAPCAETLDADVDCPATATCKVTATDPNGSQSQTGFGGVYHFNFSYPLGDGPEPVDIKIEVTQAGYCHASGPPPRCSNFTANYTRVQEAYSADDAADVTGPVKVVSLTGPDGTNKVCSTCGSQTISVTVGIDASLQFLAQQNGVPYPPFNQPPLAYKILTKNGYSMIIRCPSSTGGNGLPLDAIAGGCSSGYAIKTQPTPACDDGLRNPQDCVQVHPGGGTTKPLSDAFTGRACTSISLPPTDPSDPRIIELVVVDWLLQAAGQTGDAWFPVNNIGAFYLTGWGVQANNGSWSSTCALNNPPPPSLLNSSGKFSANAVAIWGYYIPFVDPGGTPSPTLCPAIPGFTPCTPAMTQ